jgi:hypothetical protein
VSFDRTSGEAQCADHGIFREGAFDDAGTGLLAQVASNAEASRTVTWPGPQKGEGVAGVGHAGTRITLARRPEILARSGRDPLDSTMRFRGKQAP